MSESFFLLLIALLTKHLIVDFPLQAFPYQYKNKGTYGASGWATPRQSSPAGDFSGTGVLRQPDHRDHPCCSRRCNPLPHRLGKGEHQREDRLGSYYQRAVLVAARIGPVLSHADVRLDLVDAQLG